MSKSVVIARWIGRLFVVYGAAAIIFGLAGVFVVAMMERTEQTLLVVAGGIAGVAISKILRTAHMPSFGRVLRGHRHA